MKTVEMYEIGEVVLIKASVTEVVVDQGKLKYKLRVEHTNDELEHAFTENQMQPMPKAMGIIKEDGSIHLNDETDRLISSFNALPKDDVTPV